MNKLNKEWEGSVLKPVDSDRVYFVQKFVGSDRVYFVQKYVGSDGVCNVLKYVDPGRVWFA
ncbi:hypothetical protein [Paenibacillus sp. FSL L8-0708]|uniref:hypothetical protein n=1 Tax=Paenibacillus sp. FSL L8-0708 TaxID=2975311 RepID=UPI0030FBFA32